ncbi:MAG: YciI family protein [Archangium sp.]
MRFMVMHKVTEQLERGLPPDQSVIDGVNALIGDAITKKIFVGGEGLKPTAQRIHVAYSNGKRVVTSGPFQNAKELVGGYALFSVHSRDEALSWCDRFAALLGNVELFLGPVVEEWDLTGGTAPANAKQRYLAMHRLEENAPPPSTELMQKMGALIAEMEKAGVLQSTAGLHGTKQGARVRFAKGKRATVIDGPFAESKELVAGYAILDLPSKAEAIEWAGRFGEVVQVDEVEVRQIFE